MATKKKAAKRNGGGAKLDIGSDPPILVGGGGSSLIWVDFNQNQTTIPPGSAGNAPSPTTPSKYALSKILNQPAKLFFNNGTTPGKAGETPLIIPPGNQGTWYIRFAKPGEGTSRKKARKK